MHKESSHDRRLRKTGTPGVYKRGSCYCVVYRDPSGKQRKRSAMTLAEARDLKGVAHDRCSAERVLRELQADVQGLRAPVDLFVRSRTARGIRPATLAAYRHELGLDEEGNATGKGACAYFGRMQLAAIRPQDIKAYAAEVAKRGVAKNTVRLAIAPVKAMLATAHEEGLVRSNPAAGLRLGRAVANAPVKGGLAKAGRRSKGAPRGCPPLSDLELCRYCLTMIGPLQTGSVAGLAVAPPMSIETFV
jgi:hypothetical protein